MPTGLNTDKGFIGTGDLMVRNLGESGAQFRPVGNATLFQLTPKIVQVERKSFQRATRGQTLETIKSMDGVEVRIEIDTFGRDNLALALAGNTADLTQDALTAQAVTLSLPHGQWVELGAHNVSAVSIADKVEDEDFLVKPEAGMIMALADGGIADNAETAITFNAPAINSGEAYSVNGGAVADTLLQLRLDGHDEASGKSVITDVWRVRVSPQEAVNFLTNEFNKLVLTGLAETPEGGDSPFRTRVLPAMGQGA
jgi:hypothetical protein